MIAIAADWVSTTSGADLTVTINTEVIKFSDYLTGFGTGFLGFVDEAEGITTLIFGTEGKVLKETSSSNSILATRIFEYEKVTRHTRILSFATSNDDDERCER
jgi:hypothetical protein